MNLVLSDEDDEETNCVKTWRWLVLARCNFVAVVDAMMETEFLYAKTIQLTAVKTKEEYFGFHAREVSYIHHHRLGRPHGLYFRLHDDRVFDASGKEQEETDRGFYDQDLPEIVGNDRTLN
ncbi:MAG TPA: hypothetical protein VN737_05270 [Bryobacteraceae bacterium]|nr:hypothetical protein [Bryobacteraceae bacterium]